VSKELPEILSDEEFARMLQERDEAARALRNDHDRWDNSERIPPPRPSDGLPESTIEQHFPRIAQKLVLVWPSKACAEYLTSLIVTEREARQGFPPEVIEDLLMLHSMNDMILRSNQTRSALNSTPDKLPPHF
jgi:hypothetical protein